MFGGGETVQPFYQSLCGSTLFVLERRMWTEYHWFVSNPWFSDKENKLKPTMEILRNVMSLVVAPDYCAPLKDEDEVVPLAQAAQFYGAVYWAEIGILYHVPPHILFCGPLCPPGIILSDMQQFVAERALLKGSECGLLDEIHATRILEYLKMQVARSPPSSSPPVILAVANEWLSFSDKTDKKINQMRRLFKDSNAVADKIERWILCGVREIVFKQSILSLSENSSFVEKKKKILSFPLFLEQQGRAIDPFLKVRDVCTPQDTRTSFLRHIYAHATTFSYDSNATTGFMAQHILAHKEWCEFLFPTLPFSFPLHQVQSVLFWSGRLIMWLVRYFYRLPSTIKSPDELMKRAIPPKSNVACLYPFILKTFRAKPGQLKHIISLFPSLFSHFSHEKFFLPLSYFTYNAVKGIATTFVTAETNIHAVYPFHAIPPISAALFFGVEWSKNEWGTYENELGSALDICKIFYNYKRSNIPETIRAQFPDSMLFTNVHALKLVKTLALCFAEIDAHIIRDFFPHCTFHTPLSIDTPPPPFSYPKLCTCSSKSPISMILKWFRADRLACTTILSFFKTIK